MVNQEGINANNILVSLLIVLKIRFFMFILYEIYVIKHRFFFIILNLDHKKKKIDLFIYKNKQLLCSVLM